jgi:RNA polymerase sigma factor (sigma-70 family)
MPTDPAPLDSTYQLLQRIRGGESAARDQLLARYLPVLRAWAHGRLPAGARGMADTDDLVQVTLIRALNRLEAFEYRHEGAFLAYLRHSVLNAVRQEIRRARRKPTGMPIGESRPDPGESVTANVIGREMRERYEEALMDLTESQREAVMLRLEFGLSFPEIAQALGRPTPGAARLLVVRGLVKLAEQLSAHAPGKGE